jgi:hypothetical protein
MFTLAGLMGKLLAKLPVDADLAPAVLKARGKVHDKLHTHLAAALKARAPVNERKTTPTRIGNLNLNQAAVVRSGTMRAPMTPTRVARSSSPMVAPAIQEISPEQLFQKQLVSMGLSFNRRLVDIDISVLHKLYPALQSTKLKPAQDASLINSYL